MPGQERTTPGGSSPTFLQSQPTGPPGESQPHNLEIDLESRALSVSLLSRLLWSLQAALRATARENPATRASFTGVRHPLLALTQATSQETLRLYFTFVDPVDGTAQKASSIQVFTFFMRRFIEWIGSHPAQVDLHGRRVHQPGGHRKMPPTELNMRIGQVNRQLIQLRRASLRYGSYGITLEEGQVEIQEPLGREESPQ